MKKLILALSLFALWNYPVYASPSTLVDGKPKFAVATVNGKICWTQKEKDDEISHVNAVGTRTATVQDFSLTPLETAIIAGDLQYENYSDFEKVLSEKQHLTDKISDIKPSDARKKSAEIQAIVAENGKR